VWLNRGGGRPRCRPRSASGLPGRTSSGVELRGVIVASAGILADSAAAVGRQIGKKRSRMECPGCQTQLAPSTKECPECGLNLRPDSDYEMVRCGPTREGDVETGRRPTGEQGADRTRGTSAAEYHVEPFVGRVTTGPFSGESETTVAQQLGDLINRVAADGWEYEAMARVDIITAPSCLGYLFGNRGTVVPFDMVIFRRKPRRRAF